MYKNFSLKRILLALALLFALCVPSFAQTNSGGQPYDKGAVIKSIKNGTKMNGYFVKVDAKNKIAYFYTDKKLTDEAGEYNLGEQFWIDWDAAKMDPLKVDLKAFYKKINLTKTILNRIQDGTSIANAKVVKATRPAPKPKVEQPKVETPKITEVPKVEEPKKESPKTEAPKAETTKVEETKINDAITSDSLAQEVQNSILLLNKENVQKTPLTLINKKVADNVGSGKIKVILFFGHTCSRCIKTTQSIISSYDKFKDVDLIEVEITGADKKTVEDYAKRYDRSGKLSFAYSARGDGSKLLSMYLQKCDNPKEHTISPIIVYIDKNNRFQYIEGGDGMTADKILYTINRINASQGLSAESQTAQQTVQNEQQIQDTRETSLETEQTQAAPVQSGTNGNASSASQTQDPQSILIANSPKNPYGQPYDPNAVITDQKDFYFSANGQPLDYNSFISAYNESWLVDIVGTSNNREARFFVGKKLIAYYQITNQYWKKLPEEKDKLKFLADFDLSIFYKSIDLSTTILNRDIYGYPAGAESKMDFVPKYTGQPYGPKNSAGLPYAPYVKEDASKNGSIVSDGGITAEYSRGQVQNINFEKRPPAFIIKLNGKEYKHEFYKKSVGMYNFKEQYWISMSEDPNIYNELCSIDLSQFYERINLPMTNLNRDKNGSSTIPKAISQVANGYQGNNRYGLSFDKNARLRDFSSENSFTVGKYKINIVNSSSNYVTFEDTETKYKCRYDLDNQCWLLIAEDNSAQKDLSQIDLSQLYSSIDLSKTKLNRDLYGNPLGKNSVIKITNTKMTASTTTGMKKNEYGLPYDENAVVEIDKSITFWNLVGAARKNGNGATIYFTDMTTGNLAGSYDAKNQIWYRYYDELKSVPIDISMFYKSIDLSKTKLNRDINGFPVTPMDNLHNSFGLPYDCTAVINTKKHNTKIGSLKVQINQQKKWLYLRDKKNRTLGLYDLKNQYWKAHSDELNSIDIKLSQFYTSIDLSKTDLDRDAYGIFCGYSKSNSNDQESDFVSPSASTGETISVGSYTKTYSSYVSGSRYINYGEKEIGNGIVFTSTLQPRKKQDYSAIDSYVRSLKIPAPKGSYEETKQSIIDAAELITKTATTDKEKARAIFVWIAENISGNGSGTMAKGYYSVRAFEKRSATCQGFAYLFSDMCMAVGVYAEYVSGFSKNQQDFSTAFNSGNIPTTTHAWNIVYTDDGDFLVDTLWASGIGSGGRFRNSFDDSWFDVDPCYMITSHFPIDSTYQLLTPPLQKEDFITLPRLDPTMEKLGIDGKEILEFVYTHLDTWTPAFSSDMFQAINKGTSVNFCKIPMSSTLEKGKDYPIAVLYDGNMIEKLSDYNSQKWIEHKKDKTKVYLCSFELSDESIKPYRSDYSTWASVNQKIFSDGKQLTLVEKTVFTAEDSIKLKTSARGNVGKDGKITINGYTIPKTEEIIVVPKGTIAVIDGTEPIADPPYIEPGACSYTFCENDSAFPVGRKVKLSSFAMSKYPVSREFYKKVLENVDNFGGLLTPSWKVYTNTQRSNGENIYAYYLPNVKTESDQLPVSGICYYDAVYFCNALTKLVMGEENCVYCIQEEKRKIDFPVKGISGKLTDEEIDGICKELNIPRENILSMYASSSYTALDADPPDSRFCSIHFAYVTSDFSKKGYRLPTDAEWEFAARGGNPTADAWCEDLYSNPKSPNALGICDWASEFVEDWIVSNRDYESIDYRDKDGYVLNPCKKSKTCRSIRSKVDAKKMHSARTATQEVHIRLVRTLE